MFFKDIIGQEEVKAQLRHQLESGRIPHAQLFAGPVGTGKLPMAVAFARYLVCQHSEGGDMFSSGPAADSCGHCPACVKMNKLVHPDVHFMMPVFKRDSGRPADTYPQSDDFIFEWRKAFLENPYLDLAEWMHAARAVTSNNLNF